MFQFISPLSSLPDLPLGKIDFYQIHSDQYRVIMGRHVTNQVGPYIGTGWNSPSVYCEDIKVTKYHSRKWFASVEHNGKKFLIEKSFSTRKRAAMEAIFLKRRLVEDTQNA